MLYVVFVKDPYKAPFTYTTKFPEASREIVHVVVADGGVNARRAVPEIPPLVYLNIPF